MMIPIRRCTVCDGALLNWLDLPAYPLLTSACRQGLDVPLLPLVVGRCPTCSHVQLTEQPTSAQLDFVYLGDYTSVLEQGVLASADQLALDCRSFLDFAYSGPLRTGAMVLEIGCFDGAFLGLFPGCELYGCEPNPIGRLATEHHGVNVIPHYFRAADFAPASLDLVVMRHLIEHLPDPLSVLDGCRHILRPGGGLLIETPNVEHTLDQGVIGNFYHQHLHYFSRASLPALLARAGLRVVAHAQRDFRQFVLATPAVRPGLGLSTDGYASVVQPKLARYAARLQSVRDSLAAWCGRSHKPLAIWGASSVATGIVHAAGLPASRIAYLVDVDPRKRGMVLPGTTAVVDAPERLAAGEVDTVLIASDFFKDEICMRLQRDFAGTVKRTVVCHPEFAEGAL